MYRGKSLLLFCDGKAKIDFGEPSCMLSTGVRGKKSLVPTTSILGALDHDVNQKGKCTNYMPYYNLIICMELGVVYFGFC